MFTRLFDVWGLEEIKSKEPVHGKHFNWIFLQEPFYMAGGFLKGGGGRGGKERKRGFSSNFCDVGRQSDRLKL